ncbi:TraB/VirB10 family protein [Marinospirillum insulare]|uniref:Conjugal transfer pilus assembly protein TraB n=1 Tax=Marinospirillum insulare TaxID=217169 RepID=A0ABQ6A0J3_9GAMM|nr:TraB/VirB10 family protein [Marinospirillum insulare]GLR65093.1 hypothetical protein GCM10007878_25320 [Marinospirillum insulare]
MSKKNKIKAINFQSATAFAKKIKFKWLMYFLLLIVVMFLVIVMQGGSQQANKVRKAPEFVDATPLNTDERQVLRDIQTNLREIREERKVERESAAAKEQALIKKLELLEQQQAEEKAANKLEMERYKKQLEENNELVLSKLDNKNKVIDGTVHIPVNENNVPKIPPPPPIYINKDEDKHGRSNLPSSSTATQQPIVRSPIIIKGDAKGGNNVLVGSQPPKAQKTNRRVNNYLPEGSFAKATLLTGADFGAGKQTQSNPQPTLLRLQSDAVLPGMASYKLKSCFAIASGYGELSSGRVYLQATRLSCVQETTGDILSASVLGYLVDSDGKLGLRGTVERREGMLLGKAMLAGFAEGIAKIMTVSAQNSEQIITGAGVMSKLDKGDAANMAAWSGFDSAMSKLADRYIAEADSIFPVIEIDAGRRASIVFQTGQNLDWKSSDELVE